MNTTHTARTETRYALPVPGTRCQFSHYGNKCYGDGITPSPAVHVLLTDLPAGKTGTALCAYHSPYDVTPEQRPVITTFDTSETNTIAAIVLGERDDCAQRVASLQQATNVPEDLMQYWTDRYDLLCDLVERFTRVDILSGRNAYYS